RLFSLLLLLPPAPSSSVFPYTTLFRSHGMQLVDEDDGVALVLGQLLQHRFEALLELAAVLRPGEQRRQVEHQQALVLQALGHLAVDDALRQAFDDRGLADARLTDQHRVVLGAALQDLDAAADLVVAADDRVELALAGPVGQVERVLRERLALPLIALGRNSFSAPDLLDGLLKRLLGNPRRLQDPSGLPLVRRGGQEEQLRGDVLVAALLRFLVGDVKELSEVARHHYLARGAFHLGQARNGVGKSLLESIRISARLADKPGHSPVLLAEESEQQVLGLDVLVVLAQRIALRLGEGLLQLGSELFETHGLDPYGYPVTAVAEMGAGGTHSSAFLLAQ